MKMDAVIATYNREDCICNAVDNLLKYSDQLSTIYVVVNGSTDSSIQKLEYYSSNPQVKVIKLENNLGAPAGKNIGMRKSDAEIIVIIDDDAEFFSDNPIERIRETFEKESSLGIIQFKIVNYQEKRIHKNEFPGSDPVKNADSEFLISSFTGAGHAVRKSMLEYVGYYPDSFFYAHEELDLSFRAIIGGWDIKYVPFVAVYHKKDPKGRLPENKMIEKMVVNRMIISYCYLPFVYRLVSGCLWLVKAVLWSRSLCVPVKALLQYMKEKKGIKRNPVNKVSMQYIKANYGRLWY